MPRPAPPLDDHARIARLQADIAAALTPHLDRAGPVGLVNFPNHRNAGDSALWLAGDALLGRLTGGVRYRCAWNGFDRDRFERAVGDGALVLNAGGNLGDLYPGGQQRLRQELLAAFPGRRVVQLPQSIHFRDRANLERFARLVADQGRTTVLCRDEASLALARRWFDAEVAYCPDLALALGPLARPRPPVVDVLWLSRTDPERLHQPPDPAPDVEVVDWLHPLPGEPPWPPGRRLAHLLDQRLLGGAPEPARPQVGLTARVAAATFGPLARGWVARGLAILARGRVVVTDRLHGHLLAFLAGIPSVVLDNSYGKVHGVVALTTAGSPRTHLASSPTEALGLARDLVRSQP